jgi:hypothetical protein
VKIDNDAAVFIVVVMTLLKQMPLPAAKKKHCNHVRGLRLLRNPVRFQAIDGRASFLLSPTSLPRKQARKA